MSVERVAALAPLLPLLAVPAWIAWTLVRDLRAGKWRRPGWFARAGVLAFVVGAVAWLVGLFAGGLDPEETCVQARHQPWDAAYREAHHADWFRLFPLSNKCNAGYDLVPPWVNPTVAACALLTAAALVGLLWTVARRRRGAGIGAVNPPG